MHNLLFAKTWPPSILSGASPAAHPNGCQGVHLLISIDWPIELQRIIVFFPSRINCLFDKFWPAQTLINLADTLCFTGCKAPPTNFQRSSPSSLFDMDLQNLICTCIMLTNNDEKLWFLSVDINWCNHWSAVTFHVSPRERNLFLLSHLSLNLSQIAHGAYELHAVDSEWGSCTLHPLCMWNCTYSMGFLNYGGKMTYTPL